MLMDTVTQKEMGCKDQIYLHLTHMCRYLGQIPTFDLLMLFVQQCWWLPTFVRDLEQTPGSS